MVLRVVVGNPKAINRQLLLYASRRLPALIIDCANVANPLALFPDITEEQFRQMYVFELEMLYKFRDILVRVPDIADQLHARIIVVTTSDYLFNYQDEVENVHIYEHAWELLEHIGKTYDVVVSVIADSIHETLAKKIGPVEYEWDTHSAVNE